MMKDVFTGEVVEDRPCVLMGSLYMDVGEGWSKVESQFRAFAKIKSEHIVGFSFDVLCLKNQRPAAKKMAERIAELTLKSFPFLEPKRMVINVMYVKYKGHDPRYDSGKIETQITFRKENKE